MKREKMNTLKKRTGRLAGLALAALLVLPGLASAATYYVSTTGNDAAPPQPGRPLPMQRQPFRPAARARPT